MKWFTLFFFFSSRKRFEQAGSSVPCLLTSAPPPGIFISHPAFQGSSGPLAHCALMAAAGEIPSCTAQGCFRQNSTAAENLRWGVTKRNHWVKHQLHQKDTLNVKTLNIMLAVHGGSWSELWESACCSSWSQHVNETLITQLANGY